MHPLHPMLYASSFKLNNLTSTVSECENIGQKYEYLNGNQETGILNLQTHVEQVSLISLKKIVFN